MIARRCIEWDLDGDRNAHLFAGRHSEQVLGKFHPGAGIDGRLIAREKIELSGCVVERIRRVHPKRQRHIAEVGDGHSVIDHPSGISLVRKVRPSAGLTRIIRDGRRQRPTLDDLRLRGVGGLRGVAGNRCRWRRWRGGGCEVRRRSRREKGHRKDGGQWKERSSGPHAMGHSLLGETPPVVWDSRSVPYHRQRVLLMLMCGCTAGQTAVKVSVPV